MLNIRPKEDTAFDILSLGEVMLRLDPGEGRIHTTRNFKVWEGGGEYNVARALRRCFGQRAAVVTSLTDNPVGHLLEDCILTGGVDMRYCRWIPYDGIGKSARIGLNFTERGYGLRGALGCSDRGYSAASLLKAGDIDWDSIFGKDGVRWFHSGGIFAALSETTPDVLLEAFKAAKRHGTVISYDLNYRASLWNEFGGLERAREVNHILAPYVDVMIGNEEDFSLALGFNIPHTGSDLKGLKSENFQMMIHDVIKKFPNFKVIATTLREVVSASRNHWSALLYYNKEFFISPKWENLEIYDRVGGGDSFASGLIYSFLEGFEPDQAVAYGAAHGALAMTTPGDTSMSRLEEVARAASGGNSRVIR